jgi:transposase InsO family protein
MRANVRVTRPPAVIADTSISGRRVARELDAVVAWRGRPDLIVSDHGTEFTSNAMLAWSQERRITWHFIAPGKPMQNAERDLRSVQWQNARRTAQ